MPSATQGQRAFSLIELLVSIGIIAVLLGILLPTLSRARTTSRRLMCLSNLHQLGIAIHNYANENNGCIPYGPKAPPFTATNFYPSTGVVTSLISLENGSPVALGLMLSNQLANTKMVLFCPDADQDSRAQAELAKVGTAQAQCDYYYRHGSGSNIYADSGTDHLKLANLGRNTQGQRITALALDVNYLVDPGVAIFGVYQRTSHHQETVNVLFADGHAAALSNARGEYTVDARDNPHNSFPKILAAFETADPQP